LGWRASANLQFDRLWAAAAFLIMRLDDEDRSF
jgi:hypothetical protein